MSSPKVLEEATLYLDADELPSCQGYKAETRCVILLSSYCRLVNLSLVMVVTDEGQTACGRYTQIQIPKFAFNDFQRRTVQSIPSRIKDCQLPAVCTQDGVSIYSGLCTVLRYIVKRTSDCLGPLKGGPEILDLLGHRMYCLKACSEASPRTKLCEVQMTSLVNEWQRNDPASSNTIPTAICLFEELMSQDVIIHNMDKRQRTLLNKLEQTEDTKCKSGRKSGQKRVVWTKDLPQLEHAFTEGVDFTLSDICIFPCVNFYLEQCDTELSKLELMIPHTMQWYKRVKRVAKFKKATSDCGISFIDTLESCNDDIQDIDTQILQLKCPVQKDFKNIGQEKNEKMDLTIRRDLPPLLQKLESKNVLFSYSSYEMDDIKIDWSTMPREVHPTEGELTELRARRKCHQIQNLLQAVKGLVRDGNRIVDFCSGGGHVGIVMAYMFPKCHVVLVENKEESLQRARARIKVMQLANISIYQCNLEFYKGSFDIGVALHACGVASDMVIRRCMDKRASFVVSPCCYGKVRDCYWITYPQSNLFKSIPVSFEENLLLGHAADQTTWDFESKKAKQGKRCMGYVDLDRVHAAQECGYHVTLYSMTPTNCSPKNNMLVGKSTVL